MFEEVACFDKAKGTGVCAGCASLGEKVRRCIGPSGPLDAPDSKAPVCLPVCRSNDTGAMLLRVQVLVLDKGKVVEYDTPLTLLTRKGGAFRDLAHQSGNFDELLRVAREEAEAAGFS